MRYYCTYFDRNYLSRGLSLIESIGANSSGEFIVFVLCLDDFTLDYLSGRDSMIYPVSIGEVENYFPELLGVKADRTRIEYIFTLTPHFTLYLVKNYELDVISYLDADIRFFDSTQIVFDELGDHSVLIIPHNFSDVNRGMEKNGKFNVGLVMFRNDAEGMKCLEWWKDRCLEWCYDRAEEGKFADQKYLDSFPELFRNVRICDHPGLNVAPYNLDNYEVTRTDGKFYVDGRPLVFFHYHRLKEINKMVWNLNLIDKRLYKINAIEEIYRVIIRNIVSFDRKIRSGAKKFNRYAQRKRESSLMRFLLFERPFYFTPVYKGIIDVSNFSKLALSFVKLFR